MRFASSSIPAQIVATDEVGEILVKSDCLFKGYFNRPILPQKALVDGWYHTGDLGFLLEGELYVVGRKKDLLIVGGENIYPQDIEEIVASHSAVHDGRVIAMGVYNPDLGTEDIVVVAEVESEELLANARNRARDSQPGRSRHGSRGTNDFSEATQMDCEEHGREGGSFCNPRETSERTSGTER